MIQNNEHGHVWYTTDVIIPRDPYRVRVHRCQYCFVKQERDNLYQYCSTRRMRRLKNGAINSDPERTLMSSDSYVSDDGFVRRVGRITRTFLGIEDHGVFTAYIDVQFDGSWRKTIGGYELGSQNPGAAGRFVQGILQACGTDSWESLTHTIIYVLFDTDGLHANAMGIAPLPFEKGSTFLFADTFKESVHQS